MTDQAQSTKDEIIDATREALVEHGYADLSMGKIADEFGRSQSLLHYHFDSKEKLIAAVLRRERKQYKGWFQSMPTDPEQRLDLLVESFVREYSDWADREPMAARYSELLAAANHSEPIQMELQALFDRIREEFVETVREGVDDGTFQDVDPEHVGHLITAANASAGQYWLLDNPEAETTIADALESFVLSKVYR